MDAIERGRRRPLRFTVFVLVFLLVMGVLAFVSLLLPFALLKLTLAVKLGEVASQDLRAPARTEFVSQVLTGQERDQAERAVSPVFSPPDESIGREQLDLLREALGQIGQVRADPTILPGDKVTAIAEVSGLELPPDASAALAILSDARWNLIEQESLRILEQVMRERINGDGIEGLRSTLSSRVTLALSDEQAQLVAEIVSPFVIPNSFYSPELTDQARQAARDGVEPLTRTFLPGQIVVQRGTVIDEVDLEALAAVGLLQQEADWKDYAGAAALVIVLAAFVCMYFWRRQPALARDTRGMLVIGIVFVTFLIIARLVIPGRTVVPYIYPLPAFALIVTALFGVEPAIVLSIPLALLAPYGLAASEDLVVFYLLTSLCGGLALLPARRVGHFLRAGGIIVLAGLGVLAAYRVPFTPWDWTGLATLAGATFLNGVGSASIALLVQFFAAQFLGFTTALHLLEVSRPDHPLLQYLLRTAPGTYQHSLMVANLAEQAADAIGADSLMVRVGALYHDCGKSFNPQFFIENQPPDRLDPHDDMDPTEAARLVIRHIPDGLALARKHRLPHRVLDFIAEHHGTLITRYQYGRAVQLAQGDNSQVDIEKFRYPGPTPRSRETAILMIADMTEARIRSERPQDDEALRTSIQRSIEICQQNGQLDDTKLTLRDLHLIAQSLVAGLQGSYHPRIAYPSAEPLPVVQEQAR